MTGALETWIDGLPAGEIPADDRGLQYGDGLFETVAVRNRVPRFLEAHLSRLGLGCGRLGIPSDFLDALRSEIRDLIAASPAQAVLKVIVTRGSALQRGYAPLGAENPRRIVSVWPAAALPPDIGNGVELVLASGRLGANPLLAGIKHLNRLENVLAAREARQAGAFEALMLNVSEQVISGSMTNVFMVKGGALHTPLVDQAGVAGVLRSMVLRECVTLGIAASERNIGLGELVTADEVFVTNVRLGVVPVRRVGEHRYHMNAIASRLAARIEALDA